MTKLIVRYKGQVSSELVLDQAKSWIAGRKSDADLFLEGDKGISREHFKIEFINGNWNLEVLSKLGNVTVNGESVSSMPLTNGATFSLASYEFKFVIIETVLGTDPGNHSSSEASFDDRTMVHQVSLSAYIKIMNEEGDLQQKIKLEGGDTWTAGRDVSAQIMISDHRVSRKQFEIRKTTLGYEIVDLGSVNGTYINEKVLESDDAIILKSGDIIRVLNHTLVFEILDPNFFDKIEKLPVISEPANQNQSSQEYMVNEVLQHVQQNSQNAENFDNSPAEDPAAARTKKIRIGLIALIVVGAIFYLFSSPSDDSQTLSNVAPSGADPLAALTPQQKSEYKQSLELAKRYHMEGNYNLALSETEELIKKYSVKDPELERVKNTAQAAIESQKLLVRQEKEAKERQTMESRIQSVTEECGKDLNRYNREEELDTCLVEALQLNPSHPSILDLKTKMQAIMVDKEARRQQQADYSRRVSQLKSMYQQAQKIESENEYVKTIEAYKKVINSSLPDPDSLKNKSEKQLAKLKIQMDKKIKEFETQAVEFKTKQEFKKAILVLRAAVKIDPTREDLKTKSEDFKNELRKQMMTYYQEGVLEEGFGNVEGGDNRVGAKEKWKKILELDVTDGEYYQKAFIKLKKYGGN